MNKELKFKIFLNESESDLKDTISVLPEKHAKLLDGLKIKYTCGNTLDFDKKHVGQIKNDKMIISAPWNYSRQFTTLHEVGHLIWCQILDSKQKKEWKSIVKNTKTKIKEKNIEELFCMAYANYYSKNKLVVYSHESWSEFIKSV